jgi:hypothetical protein
VKGRPERIVRREPREAVANEVKEFVGQDLAVVARVSLPLLQLSDANGSHRRHVDRLIGLNWRHGGIMSRGRAPRNCK